VLNVVIPMAGRGRRFAEVGYTVPKPLIPVAGEPMIRRVIDNLRPSQPHRFIFLALAEHLRDHDVAGRLRAWAPNSTVVPVDSVTEGAACTVLLAADLIDGEDPVLVANCDQLVETDIDAHLAHLDSGADGLILTMTAHDPRWSFVRRDAAGFVAEVVEKRVISDEATVGLYTWRHGSDLVADARSMIARDDRVLGEFYLAPVYNVSIARGARILPDRVGTLSSAMHGLGTPADLDAFHALPPERRAAALAASRRSG
jgi:dTDP-glucose pyrophosphorylase